MTYGAALVDTIQSSTANTPVVFKDGNGTQIGTLCRAWVNFNGITTATIRSSYNVSSITRNSTGDYTVNFSNALPDANYAPVVSVSAVYSTTLPFAFIDTSASGLVEAAPTTTAMRFITTNNAGTYYDVKYASVAVFS